MRSANGSITLTLASSAWRNGSNSVKQAAFGESVLGRYAAAEVEERLDEIVRRLEALESLEAK